MLGYAARNGTESDECCASPDRNRLQARAQTTLFAFDAVTFSMQKRTRLMPCLFQAVAVRLHLRARTHLFHDLYSQARTQPVLHLLLGHVLARFGKEQALKSVALCADSPFLAYSAELLLYLALEVCLLQNTCSKHMFRRSVCGFKKSQKTRYFSPKSIIFRGTVLP